MMVARHQALPAVRERVPTARSRNAIPWGKIIRYLAVAFVVFISLAPLYWTFATSVKSGVELNVSPPTLIPHTFSLENYVSDLSSNTFIRDLINSTIIAAITTVLALFVGILCAYAIARTKFHGKSFVLGITLSVQMIPFIAMVGPLFVRSEEHTSELQSRFDLVCRLL